MSYYRNCQLGVSQSCIECRPFLDPRRRTKIEFAFIEILMACHPQVLMYMDCLHGKWPLDAIKAVFSRRFLLQNCAVEVYTSTGSKFSFCSFVLSLQCIVKVKGFPATVRSFFSSFTYVSCCVRRRQTF